MAVVALAAVAVMEVVTAGVSERNPMRALPVFGSQFWDEVVDCGSGQGTDLSQSWIYARSALFQNCFKGVGVNSR